MLEIPLRLIQKSFVGGEKIIHKRSRPDILSSACNFFPFYCFAILIIFLRPVRYDANCIRWVNRLVMMMMGVELPRATGAFAY